ncbi:hypothetical protein C8R42DRAFT_671806 [Lentinula raphanica]|nr:hypothetical protein C8R42DRAFT_671806 [Lentinula raphanica]
MEDSQNYGSPHILTSNVPDMRCERLEAPMTTANTTHSNLEHSQDTVVNSNVACVYPRPSSHSSVFPIRLLSTEILQLVFLFAVSHQWHEFATYIERRDSPRQKQSWAGALSLTWVCSWWRRVALSYPTIWRSIHINTGGLPLDDIISLSSFAEFAGELLRRSGPCLPLDIGLEVHHSWPRLHDVDLAAVLVLLNHIASYTGRWRRFHITSNVPRALKLLTDTISTKVAAGPTSNSIISNPFPLLEEFSLNRNRAQENLGFRFTLSYKRFFSHFTSLRSLRISVLQTKDALDLRNLVVLHASCYDGHTVGSLLEHCPHLQYLAIGHFRIPTSASSMSSASGTSVVHTQLRTLCLFRIGEQFPTGVWNNNLMKKGTLYLRVTSRVIMLSKN